MFLWIIAGYCLAAVCFYSYLVATAVPDPTEEMGTLAGADDQRGYGNLKKAA